MLLLLFYDTQRHSRCAGSVRTDQDSVGDTTNRTRTPGKGVDAICPILWDIVLDTHTRYSDVGLVRSLLPQRNAGGA